MLGHRGKAALGQGQRRGVLGHEGLLLAHFESAGMVSVPVSLVLLLLVAFSLHAKVVAKGVKVVVEGVEIGGALGWACPSSSSVSAAAYLGVCVAQLSARRAAQRRNVEFGKIDR